MRTKLVYVLTVLTIITSDGMEFDKNILPRKDDHLHHITLVLKACCTAAGAVVRNTISHVRDQ